MGRHEKPGSLLDTVKRYGKAFVGTASTFLTVFLVLASDPDVMGILPPKLAVAFAGVGTFITGWLIVYIRNKKTIDQVDAAIESGDFKLEDLEELLEKWKQDR